MLTPSDLVVDYRLQIYAVSSMFVVIDKTELGKVHPACCSSIEISDFTNVNHIRKAFKARGHY